jgi:hypothetical protein
MKFRICHRITPTTFVSTLPFEFPSREAALNYIMLGPPFVRSHPRSSLFIQRMDGSHEPVPVIARPTPSTAHHNLEPVNTKNWEVLAPT